MKELSLNVLDSLAPTLDDNVITDIPHVIVIAANASILNPDTNIWF